MIQTKVTFKKNFSLPQQQIKLLNKQQVQLRKMSKSQLEDLLEQIVSWSCSSLYLKKNSCKVVFYQIVNIQFPNLTTLSLLENKIQSIQGVFPCHFPKLELIFIDDNFIRRIRPISKWTHSPLVYFGLSNNPIRDIEELAIFNAKKLSTLQLYYDLNWVFKMETKNMNSIQTQCKKMKRDVFEGALRKKFVGIEFQDDDF